MWRLKLFFIGIISFLFAGKGMTQDNVKPDMPFLDSVSVDYRTNSNHVIIGWQASDSSDTKGYYIYRNQGTSDVANWQVIDSVMGRTTTVYIDENARSASQQEAYRIAAFDSSHNISPMTEAHATIYLKAVVEEQNCRPVVHVSWLDYKGFDNPEKYYIYRSRDGAGFKLLAVLPAGQPEYLDTQLVDTADYCYVVQLKNNNGFSSFSNKKCVTITMPPKPKQLVALNATVAGKNKISLHFLVDSKVETVKYYRVLRSQSYDGPYEAIAKINFSNTLNDIVYTDSTTDTIPHYYKLVAYNACGQSLKTSNIIISIAIKALNDEGFRHKLYWNDIEQWPGGIQRIELHCVNDGHDRIIYTAARAQGYVHKLGDIDLKTVYYSGKFVYYVVYFENENEYGYQDSSKSNEITVYEMPRVYMPNAFMPLIKTDPLNNVFKPVASFISRENYSFIIYNRWGMPVFETHNPEEGWNGYTKNGHPVPPDTYVYFLEYTDAQGILYEKNGSVRVFE